MHVEIFVPEKQKMSFLSLKQETAKDHLFEILKSILVGKVSLKGRDKK
jgi:hypothetical protein